MIVHRFCSRGEYEKYVRGEPLINDTDHGARRGYGATTAVGFCFFEGDPEERKHQLSGIVDFDYCLTLEVKRGRLEECMGRYTLRRDGREIGVERVKEYCTRRYNREEFKLLRADTSFRGYAPNGTLLRQLFPNLFI